MSPEAVCVFCEKPGATAMVGVGDVPGVPAHVDCWMEAER